MLPYTKIDDNIEKINQIAKKIIDNLKNNVTIDKQTAEGVNSMTTIVQQQQDNIDSKTTQKKCYRMYTVQFKKFLIQKIKQQANAGEQRSIYSIIKKNAKEYGINTKNITRWLKLKQIKKKQGGRKPALPYIQAKLIQYLAESPHLKRKDIIKLAKQEFNKLNNDDKNQYKFSKGWYERFKARHLKPKVKLQHKSDDQQSRYRLQQNLQQKPENKIQKPPKQNVKVSSEPKVKIQQNY